MNLNLKNKIIFLIAFFCFVLNSPYAMGAYDQRYPTQPVAPQQQQPPQTKKVSKQAAVSILVSYLFSSTIAIAFTIGLFLYVRKKYKEKLFQYSLRISQRHDTRHHIQREALPPAPVAAKKETPKPPPPKPELQKIQLFPEDEEAIRKITILKELKIKNLISETDFLQKKNEIFSKLSAGSDPS